MKLWHLPPLDARITDKAAKEFLHSLKILHELVR